MPAGRTTTELRAPASNLARDGEGTLLPLDVVQRQGAEVRDSKSRIQQVPHDQLLLGAPASVGEPISLFGPEGLADELVCHLLTCSARRPVRSRSAIPNSVRFLQSRVIRRRMAITGSHPCFRPTWPTRSGRWKSSRVRVITQKANSWRGSRSSVRLSVGPTARKPSGLIYLLRLAPTRHRTGTPRYPPRTHWNWGRLIRLTSRGG